MDSDNSDCSDNGMKACVGAYLLRVWRDRYAFLRFLRLLH